MTSFNPTLVRLRPQAHPRPPSAWSGFNPTLVRLRLFHPDRPRTRPGEFQSHAGSIEAGPTFTWACITCLRFNPTLVRLRRPSSGPMPCGRPCFNPTLVRLRRSPPHASSMYAAGFQSHAGSIEAWCGGDRGRVAAHVSIPRWFD